MEDNVAEPKSLRERTMYYLAIGIVGALVLAIAGDYLTAFYETQKTGQAQEVSSEVMKLAQTALGGIIGVLGGYFAAKATSDKGPSDAAIAIMGRIITILAFGCMVAICLAIVGDYVTSAIETATTHRAQEVSSEVMTLVQTALGGVIGIIASYFGAAE